MKRKIEEISKEEIVEAVHKNKCSNLDGLPVKVMNKEEIVKHLEKVECPCLKKLKKEVEPKSHH